MNIKQTIRVVVFLLIITSPFSATASGLTPSNDQADLDQIWSCDLALNPKKISQRYFRQKNETFEDAKIRLYREILEPNSCSWSNEDRFINKYIKFKLNVIGLLSNSKYEGSYNQIVELLKDNDEVLIDAEISPEYFPEHEKRAALLKEKLEKEKKSLLAERAVKVAEYINSIKPSKLGDLCNLIKANDIYIRYAKLVGEWQRDKVYIKFINEFPPTFDEDSENLFSKWYENNKFVSFKDNAYEYDGINILGKDEQKNHNYPTHNTDKIYIALNRSTEEIADDMKVRLTIRDSIDSTIKSCVDELIYTDLIYVFFTPDGVDVLRNTLSKANKTPITKIRDVTKNGEVIERTVRNPLFSEYEEDRNQLISNSTPHWLVLIYGGELVLKFSGEDFIKRSQNIFAYHRKDRNIQRRR